MEQAGRGLGGWRQAILIVGLISILMVALPAQAGLGDLLDDLLDPIEDVPVVGDIVEPIVEEVVDPIVEDIVEPVAGDLVDPIVDEALAPVLTPIIDTVVAPIVGEVVTPVDNVVAPVTETIPTVGTTTTTTLPAAAPNQEAAASDSAGFGISSTGYPGGVLLGDSNNAGEVLVVEATTDLGSLEAARALQSTLIDSAVIEPSIVEVGQPTAAEIVDAGWLNGLTNWLRSSGDGLLNLLALPIRLLELLARALLTAGSGLIAPLSMLLAFTAVLIKDRRWGHAKATDHRS